MGKYCQNYGQRMREKKKHGVSFLGVVQQTAMVTITVTVYGLGVIGSRNSPFSVSE